MPKPLSDRQITALENHIKRLQKSYRGHSKSHRSSLNKATTRSMQTFLDLVSIFTQRGGKLSPKGISQHAFLRWLGNYIEKNKFIETKEKQLWTIAMILNACVPFNSKGAKTDHDPESESAPLTEPALSIDSNRKLTPEQLQTIYIACKRLWQIFNWQNKKRFALLLVGQGSVMAPVRIATSLICPGAMAFIAGKSFKLFMLHGHTLIPGLSPIAFATITFVIGCISMAITSTLWKYHCYVSAKKALLHDNTTARPLLHKKLDQQKLPMKFFTDAEINGFKNAALSKSRDERKKFTLFPEGSPTTKCYSINKEIPTQIQ